MNTKTILPVLAAATVLAGCGQPAAESNAATNNIVEAIPANAVAPSDGGRVAEPVNSSAAEAPTPAPRVAPVPEPRPAPATDKQMPLERRVDRVEPAPAPASNSSCTPEHEAMGHCKQ